MLIDAHAHVFIDPKIKLFPRHTTFMSAGQQLSIMDRMGIEVSDILALVNPKTTCVMQNIGEILAICRNYLGRFIPFCNVGPRLTSTFFNSDAKNFVFILEQFKSLGFKGLGELAARLYWDDPQVLSLFEACQEVGFPVTFHTTIEESKDYGLIDEMGFPRFEKILQKFPALIFIGHSQAFWAEISSEVKREDKWGYPVGLVKPKGVVERLMRKYSNLYADLSANSGFNALSRDPKHAYEFIDEFQDKLLFGLDYCSPNNDRPLLMWLTDACRNNLISSEAFEKVTWKNISRILELDVAQIAIGVKNGNSTYDE